MKMECAIHSVDTNEGLSAFSEVSWSKFLFVVHQWANFTGDSKEGRLAKIWVEKYGLHLTQPFETFANKREGFLTIFTKIFWNISSISYK